MTKDEMAEHIRTQATARVNRVIEGMFPGTGLTADIMGIDADFNKGLFDDVYLNLFSLRELEEIITTQIKYKDRLAELDLLVETAVAARMAENQDKIIEKLGAMSE